MAELPSTYFSFVVGSWHLYKRLVRFPVYWTVASCSHRFWSTVVDGYGIRRDGLVENGLSGVCGGN
jgi:hypothetical protein